MCCRHSKKIPPYSQAPLIISPTNQHANWFQYFSYNATRTKSSIRRLLDQLPFLDAKLVSLLTAIDDCSHFYTLDAIQALQVGNQDLSAFASSFYDYCVLCEQLRVHLECPDFV